MQQKNIYYGIGFIILALILIFGVRSWKMQKIETMIADESFSGLFENPITVDGEKYLVPPQNIFDAGSTLPAINGPVFTSVANADSYLADDVEGIDVEMNGQHRFYSYQILNWHEVVNDTFDGVNLAVTHCVLCKYSAVYETDLDFENSGLVYNNNELLRDTASDSLWSQIRGVAISGDQTGSELAKYPYEVMSWSDWMSTYPNGQVLSTDTGYTRDYTAHPYGNNYDTAKISYFPINQSFELANKAIIKGFLIDGKPFAVSDVIMAFVWAWNGVVSEKGVSVFFDISNEESRIYLTDLSEERLTFEFDITNNVFVDNQTGSTWTIDGLAIDGELTGTQLSELTNNNQMFEMCFAGAYGTPVETLQNNSIGGGLIGSNDAENDAENESEE